jgi:hypothetical protein
MRRRRLPTVCACLVAGAASAYAGASTDGQPLASAAGHKPKPHRTPVNKSPDLWATINVCDTKDHPDTVGIRGSMPGLGKPARLRMRFRVQYLDEKNAWRFSGATGDSGYQRVGHASKKVLESGQNFMFDAPDTGALTLRGVIQFRWIRHGKPVKELRRLTDVGHRSTAGADPAGYSAQTCDISAS